MTPAAQSIAAYVRATNYLVVSQLYLLNNFLLERKLTFDDIKPRLIGHWGTCPGINFVYANVNYLIKKYNQSTLFVLGPGHGFAALQANLFVEGTLEKYYPQAAQTPEGIAYISKNFSWPYGFQSHSNPTTPGAILEGGELGYSLSTAYGAILDNPDLLAVCLIGDGEAETGPLATSWHGNKFIDPATNGTVLPILHLNGYKISGPTLFGRMSSDELISLFTGYGYEPHIVEGDSDVVYDTMIETLDQCYATIKHIKEEARAGNKEAPRFPMIILRTPKGWTGIKELGGHILEGNCLSHQVIAPNAKTDVEELTAIETWMSSYKFQELFDPKKGFISEIVNLIPPEGLRMGTNPHAYSAKVRVPLKLPSLEQFADHVDTPGKPGSIGMRKIASYLREVFVRNAKARNMRLFSPDEIYSNKLDEILEVTGRAFVWPHKKHDRDLTTDGRVIEMLSEHTLQGMLEGYILTGRHGVFASYEAFVQIVSSMVDQYIKFLKIARDISWRVPISSLNIILTSSGWRQEHNGFSHQNPGFIGSLLAKRGNLVNIYFPPDSNTTLVCLRHALEVTNVVNVIVAGKTFEPHWLSIEEAEKSFKEGMFTWNFASDTNPDIVLVGIGDYMSKEALAAIKHVRSKTDKIKMRFVNVVDVTALSVREHKKAPRHAGFETYFPADKPVLVNYHGTPETLRSFLVDHNNLSRFSVHGYIEHGSITTPFDMQVRNRTSRFHLSIEIFELMSQKGIISSEEAKKNIEECELRLKEHRSYIKLYGVDPEDIASWQWQ